jgi:DNA modification methylase
MIKPKENKIKTFLDGKTWLRYSISVWDDIEKSPEERMLNHPAIYPSSLVERLIDCYLWNKGIVLDPFLGSGSTLVAALKKGHSGVGVEVVPDFAQMSYKRLRNSYLPSIFNDKQNPSIRLIDRPEKLNFSPNKQELIIIKDTSHNLKNYISDEIIDLIITSPPYWTIHRRLRTADFKKPRPYSDNPQDLGNIEKYEEFIRELGKIFSNCFSILKTGAYCIVNVMDLRYGSKFIPYHVDIINLLNSIGFQLEDIIIWNRVKDYSNLRPLGYPYKFIVNKVHEYLIVFRKPKRTK